MTWTNLGSEKSPEELLNRFENILVFSFILNKSETIVWSRGSGSTHEVQMHVSESGRHHDYMVPFIFLTPRLKVTHLAAPFMVSSLS